MLLVDICPSPWQPVCLPSIVPPPATQHPPRPLSPSLAIPPVFEGWYFKVTLPGDGQSFALIYSIEDPMGGNKHSGIGAQVMGPDDGYLLQYSPEVQACRRPSAQPQADGKACCGHRACVA